MRFLLIVVFSLVTLCSQAQYKSLSIKLGRATTSTYDIQDSKNLSIDYRSFILRAGNKFHLDFGYVVGFSFSQFNDLRPLPYIVDYRQRNSNLSAGLTINLPITRKLRLNSAYSIGLLRSSEYYIDDAPGSGYYITDATISRSSTFEYGLEYDFSKSFSLGLSLSKIKYNDASNEIAFTSLRFSYYF